jgi:hypothetical protein
MAECTSIPLKTSEQMSIGVGQPCDRHSICQWITMKSKSILMIGGLSLITLGFAQGDKTLEGEVIPASEKEELNIYPLRTLQHDAFKPGEKLRYVVHYGWINAGEAIVELKKTDRKIHGREIWHAVGVGRSLGAFSAFYKVDDHYETYLDAEGVFPWIFARRVNEGGYKFTQDYLYMQHRREVTTQRNKTHKVPGSVQDILSAFYYARTIDFSTARPGDIYTVECFLDDELWPLRMRYMGKETIKLRNGKYRCLKFQPVVQEGRIFKGNDDLNVWITDDKNHIPVLAQAKVLVGSIKMELSEYEGLAHPIAKED